MTRCVDCGKELFCQEHGANPIQGAKHSMDDSHYYWCDDCVVQYRTAFGAIIHWCEEGQFFEGSGITGFGIARDRQK